MEEHLRNRDRLDADWEEVNTYESEEAVPCESARRPENAQKNREGCPIPCECTILPPTFFCQVSQSLLSLEE